MSEYIKREDAIDVVGRVDAAHLELKGVPMLGACTLLDEINDIPSTDVVEVIRCKDCKYHDANWDSCTYWHDNPFDQASVKETDYCSFGESKNE